MAELMHYGIKGMKWGRRKSVGERAATRREKILRSPTKLYRHRDEFTQEEIDTAMKRMKWERELRGLSRDTIGSGAQVAQAVLGYGILATSVYNLVKSPAGQVATKKATAFLVKQAMKRAYGGNFNL